MMGGGLQLMPLNFTPTVATDRSPSCTENNGSTLPASAHHEVLPPLQPWTTKFFFCPYLALHACDSPLG